MDQRSEAITITGAYNTAVVFADQMDTGAEGLLRALCASPISAGSTIRVMPDVHAGKGCAIGTTITITDWLAPGLVGTDIGCGMTVCRISGRKPELQKLDKLVQARVPAGRAVRSSPHRLAEQADLEDLRCAKHIRREKALASIGTLGGGNHFVELDQGADGTYWLIIHTGSRSLGAEVATYYHERAYSETTPDGIPYELAVTEGSLMDDYLHDVGIVQEFAELNRRAIAEELTRGMKLTVEDSFSTVHNYIDTEQKILRKGAVSARRGERLIIPLNMRDGCLLCIGKGNTDWNQSAPHGAGRLMSRSEAKQSLTLSQYKKEMAGIYSSSVSRNTIDESPMAYKPTEYVLAQIAPTADVIERIKPIYNFKGGEES